VKLFGTAGIRMKYPEELNPLLAVNIGNAVGRLGLSSRAYVVHDTRTTSYLLTFAVSAGLMSAGVDVVYVGTAPTPVAAYAALKNRSLGISVTASHNPPEYNGMKFYDVEGYEFTRDIEALIEDMVSKEPRYVAWSGVGKAGLNPRVVEDYVRDLVEFVGEPRQRNSVVAVVDCANGASYEVSPRVARIMGAKPVTVNCNPDGFFPVRQPEPRKDVLEGMLSAYRSFNPHIILAHDGDADRLAVLDPVEGFIKQDRILAFFAKKILERRRGHVVVSIDTGIALDDVVYEHGGTIERYPLGKTHERVKELGKSAVAMAGEPWKLIDTSWGPWVDGVLQVALLVKHVVETGKPISRILDHEGIPDYPWERRSYLISPPEVREKVYEEVSQELLGLLGEPVNVLSIDGYRYEFKDRSWVLIRKSGTEPELRLYAEAPSRERLKLTVDKTDELIKRSVKKHGGRVVEVTIG